MIVGGLYKVRVKIKLHTQPVRVLEYEKEGIFCKETSAYFIFKEFRVRKSNVLNVTRSNNESE